ncbi:Repressor protein CI [Pseudomonas sp. PA15(2017)]|uniref:S24 family peptidase n=1 Tax=Pseudomonas sp. PA15(2017) TaxID=1932111 RepID=UPI00095D20D8|nr:LexA family transcriptional regulator [Pseudomonas sp. PA15(2017)]OLU22974.1 Repressor protein CI [Pseudomonas sp. PA15(2017)]
MEFKDRFRARLDELAISQTDLAKRVGVSKSTITFWLNGTNKMKAENLMALAKALGCSARWLATGEGTPVPVVPAGVISLAKPWLDMDASDYEKDRTESDNSPSESEYALIPQYSAKGECGDGFLNDHVEVKGGLAFKREWLKRMSAKPENLFVIYAEGDSMEPYIFDGDVVLFDVSDTDPRDRQAYAIRRPDGGISIKRIIQQLSGAWLIRSDNADKLAYPDEPVSPAVLHDMPILGRVIWRGGAMG